MTDAFPHKKTPLQNDQLAQVTDDHRQALGYQLADRAVHLHLQKMLVSWEGSGVSAAVDALPPIQDRQSLVHARKRFANILLELKQHRVPPLHSAGSPAGTSVAIPARGENDDSKREELRQLESAFQLALRVLTAAEFAGYSRPFVDWRELGENLLALSRQSEEEERLQHEELAEALRRSDAFRDAGPWTRAKKE